MSKTSTQSLSQKRAMPSKLIMGLMVAAVSVLVGTAGIAGATDNGNHNGYTNGNGHSNSNGNHNGHDHGGVGYGGGINFDFGDIIGDNNVINIIINYFIGR